MAEFTIAMGNKACPDFKDACLREECVCFELWGHGVSEDKQCFYCKKYDVHLPKLPGGMEQKEEKEP